MLYPSKVITKDLNEDETEGFNKDRFLVQKKRISLVCLSFNNRHLNSF